MSAKAPHWPKHGPSANESPVWGWFGLTYSAYFCIPRLLLCGMPLDWQKRFVALIEEGDEYCRKHGVESTPTYLCQRQDERGRFIKDPWANYRHGSIEECVEFDRKHAA